MKKITLNGKKIRKINDLLISLVKPSLSRNFCQKRVRANFRNLHTVFTEVSLQFDKNPTVFETLNM